MFGTEGLLAFAAATAAAAAEAGVGVGGAVCGLDTAGFTSRGANAGGWLFC